MGRRPTKDDKGALFVGRAPWPAADAHVGSGRIPETVQSTASSTAWLVRTFLRRKRVTVETPAGKSG
jgi:hypothetical protein